MSYYRCYTVVGMEHICMLPMRSAFVYQTPYSMTLAPYFVETQRAAMCFSVQSKILPRLLTDFSGTNGTWSSHVEKQNQEPHLCWLKVRASLGNGPLDALKDQATLRLWWGCHYSVVHECSVGGCWTSDKLRVPPCSTSDDLTSVFTAR